MLLRIDIQYNILNKTLIPIGDVNVMLSWQQRVKISRSSHVYSFSNVLLKAPGFDSPNVYNRSKILQKLPRWSSLHCKGKDKQLQSKACILSLSMLPPFKKFSRQVFDKQTFNMRIKHEAGQEMIPETNKREIMAHVVRCVSMRRVGGWDPDSETFDPVFCSASKRYVATSCEC